MATKRELEAQVAELRAEVEALKAQVQWHEVWRQGHVCVPGTAIPGLAASPLPCTCGTSVACQQHKYAPPTVWISNQQANARAGIGTTFTVPVTRESMTFTRDLVAPGCAGNPAATMTYFTVDAN